MSKSATVPKDRKETGPKEALRLYLSEIAHTPLLSVEEEKDLGHRIQQGDHAALKKLVESNLKFVVKVAKKYRHCGVSFLDLINEGNLGLIEAAKRFDPDRKVKFIYYAVWWIRQSILTALSHLGRPLRLPIKINAALYKVGVTVANHLSETSEKLSLDELAAEVGMNRDDLISILEVGGEGISLNQPLSRGTDWALEDQLIQKSVPSVEQEAMSRSIKQCLNEILDELGTREQQVLRLRYGLDDDSTLTLQKIGDRIGLSREGVRQIEEKALQKLRKNRKTLSLWNVCYTEVSPAAY